MSLSLGAILNPLSAEAMAITLGRKAFLRELLLAALLPLSLPLVSLVGLYLYLHISSLNLIGLVVSVVVISGIAAVPTIFYASMRLNAATLARERVYSLTPEQLIHKPLQGPILLRRSVVAGSVKSRILAGFPVSVGFGLQFALMSYLIGGGCFLVLQVPLGAFLIVQSMIAVNLLR